ncbi:MAG TPA: hypothetical protein VGB26_14575 [Nitrospiria bacterium]|jgi:hypothetical protein
MKVNVVGLQLLFSVCLGVFGLTLLGWNVEEASAIPAFTRKYDMDCSHCHTTPPQLAEFGRKFRDNGFQIKGLEKGLEQELQDRAGKDDPEDIHPAYFPFSIRLQDVGYQLNAKSNQDTDAGEKSVDVNSFGIRNLGIIAGGNLIPGVSFFMNYSPSLEHLSFEGVDQEGELHLGWVRYTHRHERGMTNLKLGVTELDLAVRPLNHQRATTAPYYILEYDPSGKGGGVLGEHNLGLELLGRYTDGFRYAIAVINGTKAKADNNRIPDLYTRVSQTLMDQTLGVFGLVGTAPTEEDTLGGDDIHGTGTNDEPYFRAGADLDLNCPCGLQDPINLVVLYLYGYDDQELYSGSPQNARFHGGFAELNHFMTALNLLISARYDTIRNLKQGDSSISSDTNDLDGFTISVRHNTIFTNRVSLVSHVEGSYKKTQETSPSGLDQNETTVFAGVDIVF